MQVSVRGADSRLAFMGRCHGRLKKGSHDKGSHGENLLHATELRSAARRAGTSTLREVRKCVRRRLSEEHVQEAPTAKKAKHEEHIRVRARDGEEVTLSRDAARLMGTLKDLMDLAAFAAVQGAGRAVAGFVGTPLS